MADPAKSNRQHQDLDRRRERQNNSTQIASSRPLTPRTPATNVARRRMSVALSLDAPGFRARPFDFRGNMASVEPSIIAANTRRLWDLKFNHDVKFADDIAPRPIQG